MQVSDHSPEAREAGQGGDRPRGPRAWLRRPLVPFAAIAVILGGVTVGLIVEDSGGSSDIPSGAKPSIASGFEGQVLRPQLPAPQTTLRSYTGQPVSLSRFRGNALLVTFLYTHCPDICPLIASDLGVALRKLGPQASDVRVVAISVDPRGDTPKAVERFLEARGLLGKMDYLIGNAHQLGRVWKAWNVGSRRDARNPEMVAHSGLVYGISASGTLMTIYPANFQPSWIVHDVPKLARF